MNEPVSVSLTYRQWITLSHLASREAQRLALACSDWPSISMHLDREAQALESIADTIDAALEALEAAEVETPLQ